MIKKILFTLITLLIISCGNENKKTIQQLLDEGNLTELQDRRSSLIIQKGEINSELDEVTKAVNILDTAQSFVLVNTLTTKNEAINHFSSFQGIIKTDQNMIIYPEFSGRIVSVLVGEGDTVKKGQTLATSAGSLGVAPTAEDREFVLIETGGDTTMVPGNYVAKTIFDSRNSALNDPDVEILVAGASDFELYSTNNTTYKKSVVDAYNYTINGSDFDYTTYDADAAYYNEQPSTGPSPTLATRATTIYDYIPMDANFTHTLIIPELLGGKVWLEAGESASFRIEIDSYDSDASVEISAVEFTGDLYKRFGPPPQYSDDSHADLAGVGIIGIHDFSYSCLSLSNIEK